MSEDRNAPRTHRRRFLAGVGVAATAGALAAGGRAAKAQRLDGEGFRPPRHDKDAWMGSLAGDKDHRVFIDSASGVGGRHRRALCKQHSFCASGRLRWCR